MRSVSQERFGVLEVVWGAFFAFSVACYSLGTAWPGRDA